MLYRERLTVPLLWWLLAVGFAVSMLAAFGFYLGVWWGIGTAAASLAVAAALFQSSAVLIIVEPTGLRVGRAVIEFDYLAGCRPLDADQTSRRSGTEADARAHLVLRPYVAHRRRTHVGRSGRPGPVLAGLDPPARAG